MCGSRLSSRSSCLRPQQTRNASGPTNKNRYAKAKASDDPDHADRAIRIAVELKNIFVAKKKRSLDMNTCVVVVVVVIVVVVVVAGFLFFSFLFCVCVCVCLCVCVFGCVCVCVCVALLCVCLLGSSVPPPSYSR